MYRPSIPCAGNLTTQLGGGMGCLDCGGTCGKGLGLFDSGMDASQWGIAEWAIVLGGGWLLFSSVFTGARRAGSAVAGGVRKSIGRRRSRAKARRRAEYEAQGLI